MGGLTFTASPATKNSFTMTAGYSSSHYYDGYDSEIWTDRYGLCTDRDDKIGSITPQNIGTFKIFNLYIENEYTMFVDGSGEETDCLVIETNQKCLISVKGRTYRVEAFDKKYYYYYESNDYDFSFDDGEKVEITYELL